VSNNQQIINLILRGLAMAMGVAVVVLSVLGTKDYGSLITLLGIGLFAIGLDALRRPSS